MRQEIILSTGEALRLDVRPPRAPEQRWVIFLHGLGSSREGEKARHLDATLGTRGIGCVRFDFRGHGESDGLLEELTLSRLLEDLAAVLEALQKGAGGTPLQQAVLVGSSLGGLVSAWHSALRPGPVRAQLLIAPAFQLVERYLAALGADAAARWQDEGRAHFTGPYFDFDMRHDLVDDWDHYDHAQLVAATTLPTILVHGGADATVPIRLSREFAAHCPGDVRLVEVPGGDHRLSEHKDLLVDELWRLL